MNFKQKLENEVKIFVQKTEKIFNTLGGDAEALKGAIKHEVTTLTNQTDKHCHEHKAQAQSDAGQKIDTLAPVTAAPETPAEPPLPLVDPKEPVKNIFGENDEGDLMSEDEMVAAGYDADEVAKILADRAASVKPTEEQQ